MCFESGLPIFGFFSAPMHLLLYFRRHCPIVGDGWAGPALDADRPRFCQLPDWPSAQSWARISAPTMRPPQIPLGFSYSCPSHFGLSGAFEMPLELALGKRRAYRLLVKGVIRTNPCPTALGGLVGRATPSTRHSSG